MNERDMLLSLIADSYRRMATNPSMQYRKVQMDKCDGWLKRLTEMYKEDPVAFALPSPHSSASG